MEFTLSLKHKEEDFINACIQKERWAQKQLYETYYSKMIGVCLRYARDPDEAKDILHEGFIKVFRHISKYQPGTSLNAWIKRIMVNTCIDYYRKMSRRRTEEMEQASGYTTNEPNAVDNCSEQDILKSVQSLSPAYRAVFNLYIIEGFSHREIGEKLGITESTSRSNLVKARLKLRVMLAPKYADYGK
jgi:RNA polymerase sigma factor (sigma-70 family)